MAVTSNVVSSRLRISGKTKSPVGREGWLKVARAALIREGIAGVKIGTLARRLNLTRGGFYWFFVSREELLDDLLDDWERTNSDAIRSILAGSRHDGMAELHAVVDMMLTEDRYSPAWDAAMRDWGRRSTKVANAVRRVDAERIAVFKQIFINMGCTDDEALVRARISYLHQVGYDTLGIREPREERLRLLPLYIQYLTGR